MGEMVADDYEAIRRAMESIKSDEVRDRPCDRCNGKGWVVGPLILGGLKTPCPACVGTSK